MKKAILLILPILFLTFVSASVLPTSLRITVLDELGNIVEGAKVDLYDNEEDYNNSTNPVQESQLTDEKGRVTFKDLQKTKYWVNVEKGDKNNYGAGVEVELTPKKMNKSNIIIE
jgi:uncharacterized GH25 family protein